MAEASRRIHLFVRFLGRTSFVVSAAAVALKLFAPYRLSFWQGVALEHLAGIWCVAVFVATGYVAYLLAITTSRADRSKARYGLGVILFESGKVRASSPRLLQLAMGL
jgi:hypothetical protein